MGIDKDYLSPAELIVLIEQFLKMCKDKGLTPSTLRFYKSYLDTFLDWLGDRNLNRNTLERYHHWVDSNYSKGAGAYTVYSVVPRVLRWGVHARLISEIVGTALACVRAEKPPSRLVSAEMRDRCDRVYLLAWDDWCCHSDVITASKYLAITLLYIYGLRQEEIANLLWSDISGNEVTVYGNIPSQYRIKTLDRAAMGAVNYLRVRAAQYNPDYKSFNVIKTTRSKISSGSFYSWIRVYSSRLGFPPSSVLPSDLDLLGLSANSIKVMTS